MIAVHTLKGEKQAFEAQNLLHPGVYNGEEEVGDV